MGKSSLNVKGRPPMRVCPKCSGDGYIILSTKQRNDLSLVRQYGPITGTQFSVKTGLTDSNGCNRLRWLHRHGFLSLRYEGKEVFYRAIEPAEKA